MVKRVFDAAKWSWADKVIVAWPERYPDLDENDVRARFRRIAEEFKPDYIIRLTADCPLVTSEDINKAIKKFNTLGASYYNNGRDGHDVQIFTLGVLFTDVLTHKEHVINDRANTGGSSVNTKNDLYRVRKLVR